MTHQTNVTAAELEGARQAEIKAQAARAEVTERLAQALATRDWTLEAKFAMFDDTKLTTRQHVDMAIAEADEIHALCNMRGIPALFTSRFPASDFIVARTPIDAVRARILDLRAEQSEATHISTAPPSARADDAEGPWAIRRKQQGVER